MNTKEIQQVMANNEKHNQIIDEVWKCFSNVRKSMLMLKPPASENKLREYIEWYEQITTKEEFIDKCITDVEFSEKWGLKFEERELSWEEKVQWVMKNTDVEWENLYIVEEVQKVTTPTKLITITYKNETIESYE